MSEDEIEYSALPPMPSEEAKIWRYLDFTQLVSILERESLWFNRADLFKDPLEGSCSRASVNTRRKRYETTEIPPEIIEETLPEMAKLSRKSSYLNCWHLNSRESMAMWESYSIEGRGIAIQSKVARIKKGLREKGGYINREDTPVPNEAPRKKIFTLGAVRYIDYDKQLIPEGNLYAPLFHKRLSFKHEQEFRVATSLFSKFLGEEEINLEKDIELPVGMHIKVDLETMIENIYISPTSTNWFCELVKKIVERYGFNSDIVTRSSIEEEPIF